jgi:hypothetical protein
MRTTKQLARLLPALEREEAVVAANEISRYFVVGIERLPPGYDGEWHEVVARYLRKGRAEAYVILKEVAGPRPKQVGHAGLMFRCFKQLPYGPIEVLGLVNADEMRGKARRWVTKPLAEQPAAFWRRNDDWNLYMCPLGACCLQDPKTCPTALVGEGLLGLVVCPKGAEAKAQSVNSQVSVARNRAGETFSEVAEIIEKSAREVDLTGSSI